MSSNAVSPSNGTAFVCDVGGVILVDGMRTMLADLASAHGFNLVRAATLFRSTGLRDALWKGEITTREFWSDLGRVVDRDLGPGHRLDADMIAACSPLASVDHLSKVTDRLWLATNHRDEWVMPALANAGLNIASNRLVCSSQVGACKPDVDFYDAVEVALGESASSGVTYYDDQAANLREPARRGWHTVEIRDAPLQMRDIATR